MKSLQPADKEPRIKSASRWRPCAVFLLGLSLILGLAVTVEAKKPVKPPPEPPPEAEGGFIYFIDRVADRTTDWWPHEYVSETNSTGASTTRFFEMWSNVHSYESASPSLLDHGGRLFACVKETRISLSEEWLDCEIEYVDQNGNWISTSLVICDETGTESEDLTPGGYLQVYGHIPPRWFADDTMIAFLARGIRPVPPPEDEPEADPPLFNITMEGIPGTSGIYIAEVEFVDNVPVAVEMPYMVPWTSSLWFSDEWDFRPTIDSFTLTSDGSIIYFSEYRNPDADDWTAVLKQADFLTGSGQTELAVDIASPELDPSGNVLAGWAYQNNADALVLLNLDPLILTTVPAPNKKGWLRPVWSPSGQSIVFSQYHQARGARDFKLMVASPDGSNTRDIMDDDSAGGPLGWRAAP